MSSLEAALIEKVMRKDLGRVERARACGILVNELGLTYRQVAERVGCSTYTVGSLMALLKLSAEILELMERKELGMHHAQALLQARDPEVRGELAREAIRKKWRVAELEIRARLSNEDAAAALGENVPVPPPGRQGRPQRPDEASLAVARAWGDVLGAEVRVNIMTHGNLRVEIRFNSTEAALAAARRMGEQRSETRTSP